MNFSFLSGRVAVVGSRDFPSPLLVSEFVRSLPPGVCVCTGSDLEGFKGGKKKNLCGGEVDLTAAAAALERGLSLEEFPADWVRNGRFYRSAGPERNKKLVASGLSALFCFLSDPDSPSPGSSSVLKFAAAAKVPCFLFGPKGPLFEFWPGRDPIPNDLSNYLI